MRDLHGRTALVTGGSRGLGVHIARELAVRGCQVALVARSVGPLQAVADEVVAAGGVALAVPADVTLPGDRRAVVAKTEAELGPVDVLVNNAAIVRATRFADEDPDRLIRTNLLAPIELTRLVLDGMLERGCGHVVHVASIAGKAVLPYGSNYAASKAGLIQHAVSLRAELTGTGVSVSVVCPGFMRDDGMFPAYEERAPWYLLENRPTDVARSVVRAIERDRAEIIANRLPLRPMFALRNAAPGLALALFARLGLTNWMRKLAEKDLPYSG